MAQANPATRYENAAQQALLKLGRHLTKGRVSEDLRQVFLQGGRAGEAFYRDRWSHDKVVRSTHGVNCTGSCSWNVYTKNGIITWEMQATDYPSVGDDSPEYEPRGCPRGAAFSWYTYSPTRVRFPYVRGVLLDAFREAKKVTGDPVLAWAHVVENPETARLYKSARGKGGLVRSTWEEATEIISAAHVYTIKKYGPDRVAGFSPIPAQSIMSHGTGARLIQMLGGTQLSFYDWYADLPVASPQVFGDQTDVPESADWWNSSYLVLWGSNVPVTRTPDAHFLAETRYRGTKVVVVSPDYSDASKFADTWLAPHPGTDAALAMAMGHVILKEHYVDAQTPRFVDYLQKYSDAPFLIKLDEGADGVLNPGKFLTAADVESLSDTENAAFKPILLSESGTLVIPNGTLGDRFNEDGVGKWNLDLGDVTPALSVASISPSSTSPSNASPKASTTTAGTAEIVLPRFDEGEAGTLTRGVPTTTVGGHTVCTVFDLLLARYGVARDGLPGEWPTDYHDASTPGTPAWQETHTGVPADAATRIAREFAKNAEDSGGRSMILMGAGTNHWYHSDTIYRAFLTLTTITGCQGVNGGGWAHYVGQEKCRPVTGWAQYAGGLDWSRPTRQMISTGFFYLATDQWRYDGMKATAISSPTGKGLFSDMTTADTLVEASQRGWMPSFPQWNRNPLDVADDAKEAGQSPAEYVVNQIKSGDLTFACQDPDDPANFPRVMTMWRANLLGSSAKGDEYFLKHLLGADNAVQGQELTADKRPASMVWRDQAPAGKLDLLTTLDFRMTSSTLFSDVVLPAATWYEKHDLSTTDMHPFVHSFNAAIAPPWQARTDFDAFATIAKGVQALAAEHLGTRTDIVAAPLTTDTPDELALPHGTVPQPGVDAKDRDLIPGVTMPKLIPIERDYTTIYDRWAALGPLADSAGMVTKQVQFMPDDEVKKLGIHNGIVEEGVAKGRPKLDTDIKAIETILALSGTTNGRLAVQGFEFMEKRTGQKMADLAVGDEEKRITFADVQSRPTGVITSPEWSGSEHGGRRYTAFAINVERLKPWHTLTGRQHFYLDHDWMLELGEAMPVYKPPLNLHELFDDPVLGVQDGDGSGQAKVAVRFLTPHNKWAIHSQYQDNWYMLQLGRGGSTIWMSPQDAEKIGTADNEWVEAVNRNGVVAARAVVSHRIPEGTVYMHHAQERVVDVPLTETSGLRGGIHNSLTRIILKPTHLAGGYAQLTYAFNYIGPTGNNRDEVTVLRRRSQEVTYS
ncbi:MAG: nitrate reductase subunit alpha [Cellulomonadaceae bacterium]|nr:nitrate reductase subunit alpha [Cellulomonadaceae bacterium]